MQKLQELIAAITRWVTIVALAATPLVFLPFTQDPYDTNKWLLLIAAALLLLLLTGVNAAVEGSILFTFSPLAVGLGSLTLASLISTFAASPNRWEALTTPMGVATFASLFLIVLLGSHTITGKTKQIFRWVLMAVAAAAAVVAILQFFGLSGLAGLTRVARLAFLVDPLWTPLGSGVALLAVLTMVVPLTLEDLVHSKQKLAPAALFAGALAILFLAAIGVTLWRLLPLVSKTFLPLSSGWAITLEVLKNAKQALTGVGVENFLAAFTTGRPVALNAGDLWIVRFGLNASFLFHVIATMGFVGLAAALLFFKSLWPKVKPVTLVSVSLGLAILALLFLPPNLTILTTIVSLWLATQEGKVTTWRFPSHLKLLGTGFLVLIVLLVAAAVYGVGRAYAAELTFYRSLVAASKNNGTDTYNLQISAIKLNPFAARYRLTYSQTNLALATAIVAGGTGSTPKTLSDTDRQTVTQLIQQAIREAKNAVALAPNNVFMWENLAQVYQTLVGVAQGADTWSIASLQQAIQLDPTNPALRVALGGLYVAQKNYDSAIQQFLLGANLKPDYANAYYNLANAYRQNGATDKAILAYQTTLTLLKPDTSDYIKAKNELDQLQKAAAPAPVTGKPESLTKPPSTQPIVVPPLALPESSGPNALPQPASPSQGGPASPPAAPKP